MEYKKLTNLELDMMADEVRRMLPFQIEAIKMNAKALGERREALIKEGFTREEAMDIIKARGVDA